MNDERQKEKTTGGMETENTPLQFPQNSNDIFKELLTAGKFLVIVGSKL